MSQRCKHQQFCSFADGDKKDKNKKDEGYCLTIYLTLKLIVKNCMLFKIWKFSRIYPVYVLHSRRRLCSIIVQFYVSLFIIFNNLHFWETNVVVLNFNRVIIALLFGPPHGLHPSFNDNAPGKFSIALKTPRQKRQVINGLPEN